MQTTTYEPGSAAGPRFVVSYSGTRHVVNNQAELHTRRIRTCCGFGVHVDQEPAEATRDCRYCFAALDLAEKICELIASGEKVISLHEAADRLGVLQEQIAAAVGGSSELDWVSAYSPNQITWRSAREYRALGAGGKGPETDC